MQDMGKEITETYAGLAKTYSLETFDKLNAEFELEGIEANSFILRSIRRKILERIEPYLEQCEQILQGDTNMSNMYESSNITDEYKLELFKTYKKLMKLQREGALSALEARNDADAEFIKNAYPKWIKIKPVLKDLIEKMRDTWDKELTKKEANEYFG